MNKTLKRKIFFGLLLSLVVLLFSCQKEDEERILFLEKEELDFSYDNNFLSFSINNNSDETMGWTASSNDGFICFSKSLGFLEVNASEKIVVSIKRNELEGDSISSEITIKTSTGDFHTINVYISNYPENKIRVNYQILDAEYDKIHNRLFLLPIQHKFIDIYNVDEKTFDRIDCSEFYFDIEVSADGKYLGATEVFADLSKIDIEKKEVVNQYDLKGEVESFVYAPNNKVYLFPRYYNPCFQYIDLNSHQISTCDLNFISDGMIAQLHPSGKYIYGITNDWNIVKIDIQTEEPKLCYKLTSFNIGKFLWIPGDGNKIITSNKQILNINPDTTGNDITNASNIDLPYYSFIHVEYNAKKAEYYIIASTNQGYAENTKLITYDNDFNFIKNIELEPFCFINEDGKYYNLDADARYVFVDSSDQKLIIISQPEKRSQYSFIESGGIEIISDY
ncbi:MAG: hypothetical protein JEY97_10855 [Bacteroidales bacterium]|nr:hypothetical protein [Bacteroidales bacterium]